MAWRDKDDDLVLCRRGVSFTYCQGTKVHYIAEHAPDKTLCKFSVIPSDTPIQLVVSGKVTEPDCDLCRQALAKAVTDGATVRIARVKKKGGVNGEIVGTA
jgi:hypothetical protein